MKTQRLKEANNLCYQCTLIPTLFINPSLHSLCFRLLIKTAVAFDKIHFNNDVEHHLYLCPEIEMELTETDKQTF